MLKYAFGMAALASLMVGNFGVFGQNLPAATVARLPEPARRAVNELTFERKAAELYARLGLAGNGLALPVFREGLAGFYNVRRASARAAAPAVLTLVDLSCSSQRKRLWVIDVAAGRVLFHTLVAHGKASGGDLAAAFSDQPGSEMSSLGFYRTASAPYVGKHGLSLKLHGLDPGFNVNAESRAVVVHGAPYVSDSFVQSHGRLGRSQGCPALPEALAPAIVRAIQGGSVLYVHGPEQAGYRSHWLNPQGAGAALLASGSGEAGTGAGN